MEVECNLTQWILFIHLFIFVVLRIKLQNMNMLGKYYASDLYPAQN